jgi:putative Mn2+ efflux pump MntP
MEYFTIVLLAIALGMDAFVVCIVDGLVYPKMTKGQKIKTAITFSVFQSLMPAIGYFLGLTFYTYIKNYITWVTFGVFILLGIQMIIEGIKDIRAKDNLKHEKEYRYKNILIQGLTTSIDELAVGVTLLGLSSDSTIFFYVLIFFAVSFILSSLGVFSGKKINQLLKGKYGIAEILGGLIFFSIAIAAFF